MTQLRAMLYGLTGYFLWVVVDTGIKFCSQGGGALSPFVIMATLGLFGALSLASVTVIKGKASALRPQSWRAQAWIGLCCIVINYANVIALKHLPLTMFYVVVFTIPMMIAVLSAFLKQEILTPAKIACLVAGFGGAALAIGIKGGGGDWIGYLAAFVSVVDFAVYTILLRKISKTDSAEGTQLISSLFVGVFGLLGAVFEPLTLPAMGLLGIMIAAGCLNTFGGVLYNTALKNTVSTNVAQLHYTQIIFGAAFGYVLWHEVPTWNLIMGSIIIIASGMVVAAKAHKEGPQTVCKSFVAGAAVEDK